MGKIEGCGFAIIEVAEEGGGHGVKEDKTQ
jgi:hypothetical protein